MAINLTDQQAEALGALLRTARNDHNLSIAKLAAHVDMAESWLIDLEKGRVRTPGVSFISRLADALSIDAASIDIITGGLLSREFPAVRTYFRGREGLPSDAVDEIQAAIADVRRKYRRPDPDAAPLAEPRDTTPPARRVAHEDRTDEDIVLPTTRSAHDDRRRLNPADVSARPAPASPAANHRARTPAGRTNHTRTPTRAHPSPAPHSTRGHRRRRTPSRRPSPRTRPRRDPQAAGRRARGAALRHGHLPSQVPDQRHGHPHRPGLGDRHPLRRSTNPAALLPRPRNQARRGLTPHAPQDRRTGRRALPRPRRIPAHQQVERVCDAFAAALLMPRGLLHHDWTSGLQSINELARRYGVSQAAMEVRLRSLGLLSPTPRCAPDQPQGAR